MYSVFALDRSCMPRIASTSDGPEGRRWTTPPSASRTSASQCSGYGAIPCRGHERIARAGGRDPGQIEVGIPGGSGLVDRPTDSRAMCRGRCNQEAVLEARCNQDAVLQARMTDSAGPLGRNWCRGKLMECLPFAMTERQTAVAATSSAVPAGTWRLLVQSPQPWHAGIACHPRWYRCASNTRFHSDRIADTCIPGDMSWRSFAAAIPRRRPRPPGRLNVPERLP